MNNVLRLRGTNREGIRWSAYYDATQSPMQFDDSAPGYQRHPSRFFAELPTKPSPTLNPAPPRIADYIREALA